MSEPDLQVYGEMIGDRLTDREWQYAYRYFTGEWKDEAPKFMPTPQELIEAGRLCPKPAEQPTEDSREFRRRYFAAQQAKAEARRRELLAIGDDLLHAGECPQGAEHE